MTTTPVELPATPYLSNGALPSLTLVLPDNAALGTARLVLRLWDAGLDLVNGHPSPIWIGSVVTERIERPVPFFAFASPQDDADTPRDVLAQMVGTGRIAKRSDNEANTDWDGGVLLLRQVHMR